MRKNVKKQLALRVLSTAALMAMVSSIATAAFAETYYMEDGSISIVAQEDGNHITQGDNAEHTDKDETVITNRNSETASNNTITIDAEAGTTAKVTLDNVNIDVHDSSKAALTVTGDGKTEIELNRDNTLISGSGHAGLEKADDVSKGSLTIKDDLNDNGTEKEEKDEFGYSTGGDVGSLNVEGGRNGAGIGGREKNTKDDRTCQDTSNITITGGRIIANDPDGHGSFNDGRGAGIGGATNGDAHDITITGNADVTATGGYRSAGIGGGAYGRKGASNITISGNAEVKAAGAYGGGAGIGGGEMTMGKNILITDDAKVTAYGGNQGAGIGGGQQCGGSVTISGNADVTAVGANGSAGIGSGWDTGSADVTKEYRNTKVVISDNANVTAVGTWGAAAIGNGGDSSYVKTTIEITGGTVTAIGGGPTRCWDDSNKSFETFASAIGGGNRTSTKDDITVTINGTTGNTTVNASCQSGQKGAISTGQGAPDLIGYDTHGKSPFDEEHSVIVRMYNNGSYTRGAWNISQYDGDLTGYKLGDLYQTVHNRKYMEENPEKDDKIDISKLKAEDLHNWQLVDKVAPTLEKDGYADYICSIHKCCQTKHVVLPKLTPEETREVGVIYWDATAQAAPAALQGKVLSADEQTATAEKAQVESLLADKANWKLAEDVGDLMIHPAADAAGTVYEQAVKASGCQYYVIANVTAQ